MDTTSQIRQGNFELLYRQFRDQHSELPNRGMLKLFAEKLEMSDRYLSHVKCNRKNIGANVARQIEQRLKLPQGWMDNLHTDDGGALAVTNELERNFIETMLAIYRSSPDEARAMMLDAVKRRLGQT